jgi:DNA-binding MarR family transcriptional regulator
VLGSLLSVGRLMRRRFSGDQVDLGTYALLRILQCHGAMRVTSLAAAAGLDTSTVSRHVQQLERAGLVERSADPADGRAQQVVLSVTGDRLLAESIARRRAVLDRTLQHWDPEDVAMLDTLLARLVTDLEHVDPNPDGHE